MKLLLYRDLNDLVQLCIQTEKENLRNGLGKSSLLKSYNKKEPKREGKYLKRNLKQCLSQT